MPERKYTYHSAEDFTGVHTSRSIKDRLAGSMGSRADDVKQYKKSENKWKNELKANKNQNKIIYNISKKSGLRHEIKNINNIRAKASKKANVSSSDDSDSNSSLARYSSRETYRQPAGLKEMNRLDHLVTENLNNYKYQSNESINSEPKFDTSIFNLSSGTSDPLPVVTVSL